MTHESESKLPDASDRYLILGSTASPYATKLRSVMRYRRIAHDWRVMGKSGRQATADIKPGLIPMIRKPGGTDWQTDTSVIIQDLEQDHDGRSVFPDDPALRFLCQLLEDMADEWAVKPLFWYRWADPQDQAYVSRWAGAEWGTSDAPSGTVEEAAEFRDRQVGRMPIIGAHPDNAELLEECFCRMIDAFEPHVRLESYLFGSRPSVADFAWASQLGQMAVDPSPMAVMRERAPQTDLWCRRVDDCSGVEGQWHPLDQVLAGPADALLQLAGEVYLPFLIANRDAYQQGAEWMSFSALGHPYRQAPFKYQMKCLAALQQGLRDLPDEDRRRLEPILRKTGCWKILSMSN